MSNWSKWKSLSWTQRLLIFKVSIYLMVLYIGLKILSFATFKSIFTRLVTTNNQTQATQSEVDDVCWAIRSCACHLPLPILCLPQALTAKLLLKGDPTITVPVGVLLTTDKHLEAHAWVEWRGKVVLGELPDKHFQPIWQWK